MNTNRSSGVAWIALFCLISAAAVGLGLAMTRVLAGLPSQSEIAVAMTEPAAAPSYVYDRDGRKIGEFVRERRFDLPIASIPIHVRQAFLSAEDGGFYSHSGVSPRAIARAALANFRGWRKPHTAGPTQGGSTITQQLARMRFLSREKTFTRKAREAWVALSIERVLTKDQILERYLNEIFLGNESWGIEAAARNYFRKSARQLNVAEAAMLAGLPKAPTRLAPNRHWSEAKRRQAEVLERMVATGSISELDAIRWRSHRLTVYREPIDTFANAPYFMSEVRRELSRRFAVNDPAREGLRVTTTLDMTLQRVAAALTNTRATRDRSRVGRALLAVDAPTGAILAMQGGSDYRASPWNRATRARRPVGELVQPVVAALALESGLSLASAYNGGQRFGDAMADDAVPSLYEALMAGEHQRFVELGNALGLGSVADFSTQLGFGGATEPWNWIAGSGSATLPEVARAFVALTGDGDAKDPYIIQKITNRHGQVIYERAETGRMAVVSRETAYIVRQAMKDTAAKATPRRPAPTGLFGTRAASPSLHDAWAVAGLGRVLGITWTGSEARGPRLGDDPDRVREIAWPVISSFLAALPSRWRTGEASAPPRIGYVRMTPRIRLAGDMPLRPKSLPAIAGRE